MADFLYGVRLRKGHSTRLISLFNLYSELKARAILPLEGNYKGQKTITHKNTSDNPILMHIQ